MAKKTTTNEITNVKELAQACAPAEHIDGGENTQAESASVDNKAAKLPKMPMPLDRMEFIGGLVKAFVDNDASKFGGHFLSVEQMRRSEFHGDKIYAFFDNPGVFGIIVDTDGKTRATTAIIPYDGKNIALTMPHNTGKKPLTELVKAGFVGEDTWGYNPSYLRKIASYINDDKAIIALITFNHMITNNFGFPVGFYTREDLKLLQREFPAIVKYFEAGIDTKADITLDYRDIKSYFDYRAKLKDIILDGDKSDNQKQAAKELLAKIA